jgi:hypothetical protein
MSRPALIAAAVGAIVLALAAGTLLGRGGAPEPVATKVVRIGAASVVIPRDQGINLSLSPVQPAPREARATRLAGYRAWTHSNVTVLPTTAGALSVTCGGCASAVESVSVRGGAILEPTPELALALRLPQVEKRLDRARVTGRNGLRAAETPEDQAGWARQLADAHRNAATALKPVAAGSALVDRLTEARRAYTALGRAAAAGSAPDFDAARERIRSADTQLARAIGDVAPVATQPHAAAQPHLESHGPSLLLIALIVTAFGALGVGLALPQSRPRPERRPATPAEPPTPTFVAATPRPSPPIFGPPKASPPAPTPAPVPLSVSAAPAAVPAAAAPAAAAATPRRAPVPTAAATTPSPAAVPAAAAPAAAAATPRRAPVPAAAATPSPATVPAAAAPARVPKAAVATPSPATAPAAEVPAPVPAAAAPAPVPKATAPTPSPAAAAPAPVPTAAAATASAAPSPAAAKATPSPAPAPTAAAATPSRAPTRRTATPAPAAANSVRPTSAPAPAATPPRRQAPVPSATWKCELAWSASRRGAAFYAQAVAPGEEPLLVASSPRLDWPPTMTPSPDPELVAAARALARALLNAGWTPTTKGSSWYAQRFAWTHDGAPPPLGIVQRRAAA